MTSASVQVKVEPPSMAASAGPKRRRRAPATGAAEDCHTCRKTQAACDRRRPYCSQCLELGKDCSGYRTTLTWGIGVASRGKLRGLSLPVANSATRDSSTTSAKQISPTTTYDDAAAKSRKRQRDASHRPGSDSKRLSLPQLRTPAASQPGSSHQVNWQIPDFGGPHPSSEQPHIFTHRPVFPMLAQSSLASPVDDVSLSSSTGSIPSTASLGPYGDHYFDIPNEQPAAVDHSPFLDPYLVHYNLAAMQASPQESLLAFGSLSAQTSSSFDQDPFWATSNNLRHSNMSMSTNLGQSLSEFSDNATDTSNPADGMARCLSPENPFDLVSAGPDMLSIGLGESPLSQAALAQPIPTIGRALQLYDTSPRVRTLLDFYDKAICSVLVAFDGPANPYRMYVMPLALQNQGLQNAIAALATNNIRMRRLKEVPCLKGAPQHSSVHMAAVIGKPTAEEQIFKGKSIELLNAALASTGAAQDDAVLATLLVLCLFHVCDSGFSKFKTQLAGVQKLLRMRGNSRQTEFIGWIEMFFAWFDVMTSAVNDRETQIQGDSLNLVNLSDDLGEVEQFSGCEGRLFKLIARLGRLNLLSQRRQVRDLPEPEDFIYTNGFSFEQHEHAEAFPDDRHAFWREWRDVRQRLICWELDELQSPQMCDANLPGAQQDLLHISESFRYSALLYTERLACPSSPSSNRNLQNLVAQALYHINEIGFNSCILKFMLWPLFITGTECVEEEHRDVIRARCVEIQRESGFYNNVSGLELLERIWKDGNGAGSEAQAFRWRDAMPRVDGEYIVI